MAKNVKIGVSVDTNSGVASIGGLNKSFNQLGNATQTTNKYIKDIEKSFLGLSKSVIDMNAHLTQAYQGYKTLALDIKNFGSSFIEASKSFETAKTQLAFITATTHSNIDATGKAISQLEKWKGATKSSEKTFKEFNDLHTKTGYSLQDLASMFRSFSSTALNNMSFDEAKKAFESIMIASSNTSMTTEQLSMTMDSLGAGVFSASGDLRRFTESLGITNDAMSEAKKNGKLFDLFIEKTKELTKYTDYTTQTYEKQMQKFEANMQMLKAEISKPIFDALKNSLIDINTYIKDNEKEIKADIKAITEFATSFKDLAIGAGLAYVAFKSFNSFKNSSFFTSLSNGIKNVKKDYDDLIIKQKEMKELVINQRNLKFQAQSFKDAIKDLERLQSLMPQKAKELSDKNWKHFQFSSYDNPFLKKEQIKELIEEVGGEGSEVVKQEIYGEFIDSSSAELFSLSEIENAMSKNSFSTQKMQGENIWGLDVARYGDDKSVLAKRKGFVIDELKKYSQLGTMELANKILAEYNQSEDKPKGIFIDTCGLGVGVYDVLLNYGLPVFEANCANSASGNQYLNKRAQMYFSFAKNLKHMELVKDEELKKDMRMIEYEYSDKGLLKIVSKEYLKKNYGKSPDVSDAVALTFFEKLYSKNNTNEDWSYDGW